MLEKFLIDGAEFIVDNISMVGYLFGGLSGVIAAMFSIDIITPILAGNVSAGIIFSLPLMAAAVVVVFRAEDIFEDHTRRYNPKNYERRPSRWFDPTLDYDANRPLDDFKDKPELKSQYLSYNSKDATERYREL